MPFSHHSHSGQFCLHAKNTLEEMVQAAVQKKLKMYALTEHMPRDQAEDLYPEEVRLQTNHHRHIIINIIIIMISPRVNATIYSGRDLSIPVGVP